jgi:gliding motility-associated-like protein
MSMLRLPRPLLAAALAFAFAGSPANAQCLLTWDTTSTPGYGGVGTVYEAGETVEICLSVNTWNSASANWFHGFEIQLGPGWDAGSITATSFPASCDGSGNWAQYPSITSSATGASFGPGIYYDSGSGGPLDGDPGNNYGDNSVCPTPHWVQFCFTVTTLPPGACIQDADLSITLNTLGDGEAGSWSSFNCNLDPDIVFSGPVLTCCDPPLIDTEDPACPGATDGSITATGNSIPPYTFAWSTGLVETTPSVSTVSGLGAGTYTLVVTDGDSCESTLDITLTEPPAIVFSLDSLAPVTCPGGSNGAFGVTASGGTSGLGTHTYSLDGGPFVPVGFFDGLAAGSYTVTARDANGCENDTVVTVIEDNLLDLVIAGVADLDCFGDTDGAVTLVASGGIPPYAYSADGVAYGADPVLDGLAGGDYTVSVQDATGCTVSLPVTVAEPPALTLDAGEYPPLPVGDGVALAPVSNADPAVSWIWDPDRFLSCNDCPDPVASPDVTTWYTLTVTDGNGCTATDSTRILVIRDLAVPNAFSPNGDGNNDLFVVRTPSIEGYRISISNRWGQEVFRSTDWEIHWDGTWKGEPQPLGTYVYALEYRDADGSPQRTSGSLTLVR